MQELQLAYSLFKALLSALVFLSRHWHAPFLGQQDLQFLQGINPSREVVMYETDQIYLAREYAAQLQAEQAEAEADRWQWNETHGCAKDRIAVTKFDGRVFIEPCCTECYNKVWKHEGAALLHNFDQQVAA